MYPDSSKPKIIEPRFDGQVMIPGSEGLAGTSLGVRIFLAVAVSILLWKICQIPVLNRLRIVIDSGIPAGIVSDTSSKKSDAAAPIGRAESVIEEKIILSDKEKELDRLRREYIQRFAPVAQRENQKYGIPASITLAQGILESQAGTSRLAQQANNHFGIKCFSKSCSTGHCMNATDDSHKDFFRRFSSAWESFRAHSELLMRSNYSPCRSCSNYRDWAYCLKKQGYATDPRYAEALLRIVKIYRLDRYDIVM